MKVREDLVYDKTGESLHGFVNLGDVNDQINKLEMQAGTSAPYNCFATEMLTLMVRGIFIELEFPYASFPTQGIYCIFIIHLPIVSNTLLFVQVSQVRYCTGSCRRLCVVWKKSI